MARARGARFRAAAGSSCSPCSPPPAPAYSRRVAHAATDRDHQRPNRRGRPSALNWSTASSTASTPTSSRCKRSSTQMVAVSSTSCWPAPSCTAPPGAGDGLCPIVRGPLRRQCHGDPLAAPDRRGPRPASRGRSRRPWCTLAALVPLPGKGDVLFIVATAGWCLDAEAARERQALAITDLDARHRTSLPTIIAGGFKPPPTRPASAT